MLELTDKDLKPLQLAFIGKFLHNSKPENIETCYKQRKTSAGNNILPLRNFLERNFLPNGRCSEECDREIVRSTHFFGAVTGDEKIKDDPRDERLRSIDKFLLDCIYFESISQLAYDSDSGKNIFNDLVDNIFAREPTIASQRDYWKNIIPGLSLVEYKTLDDLKQIIKIAAGAQFLRQIVLPKLYDLLVIESNDILVDISADPIFNVSNVEGGEITLNSDNPFFKRWEKMLRDEANEKLAISNRPGELEDYINDGQNASENKFKNNFNVDDRAISSSIDDLCSSSSFSSLFADLSVADKPPTVVNKNNSVNRGQKESGNESSGKQNGKILVSLIEVCASLVLLGVGMIGIIASIPVIATPIGISAMIVSVAATVFGVGLAVHAESRLWGALLERFGPSKRGSAPISDKDDKDGVFIDREVTHSVKKPNPPYQPPIGGNFFKEDSFIKFDETSDATIGLKKPK